MTTLLEAVANIEGRFSSGNAIPIERAYMTRAEWDAFCDAIRLLTSDYAGWKPTATHINALPHPIRDFIMRLEANTDPAGTMRENVLLREQVAQLGWHPIETAPKDVPIDAWNGRWRTADAFWAIPTYDADEYPEGCWCYEDWHTTYEHLYNEQIEPQPTHWMPLPEAPA